MTTKKYIFLAVILCSLTQVLTAQQQDSTDSYTEGIAAVVFLDSFVVTAQRKGFNVHDFIDLVETDQSFYQAFRNLRFVNYRAKNRVQFFNKKGYSIALYQSNTQQYSDGRCRWMDTQKEHYGGEYLEKDEELEYYTSKLFERVFFTRDTICDDPTNTGISTDENARGMQKHYQSLKRLVFQPGQPVEVPFIGKKMAVFSPDMMKYYDYSITSTLFRGHRDCYLFTLKVKPEYQHKKEKRTVVKYMETYFDKETFTVVGRNYRLAYDGLFFAFEVDMSIELDVIGDKYLPQHIVYDGWWDIPLKKREIGQFEVVFENYKIP
jgi:hypothetical protein